ncbi:RING-H2 finger protein ATL38-like [Phalaenopsis equestris]|uniref:RING-H2 finger protein ATL38-like n=1 Tax=Phalaenopsis equestris TaxID=78828 RepID=UPI0009E198AB|nr:RING-H2 finger protein ATL38-like [Phalaenopsis equestris]
MISAGLNLVMTVIGFAVSTMFIVFVCTRLICARIQLQASRRSFPAASAYDLSIMERGVHGLEPVVVSSFPTKFVDQFAHGQDAQCAICLSDYQEKDILRVLPYCGHAFHVYCIDVWLRQHWTCPVCRISLRDSPDRRRKMPPAQNSSLRPLYCENFASESYQYQFGVDNCSPRLISDPAGVNETVSSSPEINCSAQLVKQQMESPSNS